MAGGKEYVLTFLLKAATDSSYNAAFNSAKQKLNEFQKAIQQNNSLLNDISGYKRQEQAVATATQKLNQKVAALQKASAAAQAAGGSNDKLNAAEAKAKNAVEAANLKLAQQTEKLNSMRAALQSAGVDTGNLATEEQRLKDEIDQVKTAQEQAAEEQQKMLEQQANMEAMIAAAALMAEGFLKVADALKSCVQAAQGFEYSMSGVEAISGATGSQMDQLSAKAKELGASTIYTATEISDAMVYMSYAGWSANETLDSIASVANLAAASGESLSRISDIVTDDMSALGYAADDASHFCDVLAKTVTSTNTNVDLLGESLKYVSSTAGALSYSIEDVSTVLGSMASMGIKASMSGTALRNILSNLAAPSKKITQALEELGISLTDTEGNVVPLNDVITSLRQSFSGLSEAEKVSYATTIAGKRGMAGLLAVVNQTQESYDELRGTIIDCDGAAEAMASIRLDNLQGSVTLLTSAWDALKTSIGETFLGPLTGGADELTGFVNQINNIVIAAPQLVAALATTVTAFLGVGAAVTTVAGAIKVMGTIFSGTVLANPAMWGAVAAVAALAGITAGVMTFVNSLETVDEEMERLGTEMNTLLETEALIDEYYDLADAMKDSGLSAEELEGYQQDLHQTANALRDAYPELLGNIEEGTAAWDAQTAAILKNIEAQKLETAQEVAADAGKASESYRGMVDDYEAATAAELVAQENLNSGWAKLQEIRDIRSTMGQHAGWTDDKASRASELASQLSGTEVNFGNAFEIDKFLQGYTGITTEAQAAAKWSREVGDAAQDAATAVAGMDEITGNMLTLIDADAATVDTFGISMQELGLTMEDVGGMVASGLITQQTAMRRYGLTAQEVGRAVMEYRQQQQETTQVVQEAEAAEEEGVDIYSLGITAMKGYAYASQLVQDGLLDAAMAAEVFNLDSDALNEFVTIGEDKQKKLAAAADLVESGYMDASEACERFGLMEEELDLYYSQERLKELETELENLQKAYDTAYTSALSSIQGQGSLLEGLALDADRTVLTFETAQQSMATTKSYWENYHSGLVTLQGYGLSTDFLTRYCDTSSDGVAYTNDLVDSLNGMSSEQAKATVDETNAKFEEMVAAEEEVAGTTADMQTNFSEASAAIIGEMSSLQTSVQTDMQAIVSAMDQSAGASAAGYATGSAYASALQVTLDQAVANAQSAADKVQSALASAKSSGSGSGGGGYAQGGFTNGPSIAGEDPKYPTEAVISFNPAYREANIGYLMTAAKMLGVGTGSAGTADTMDTGNSYSFGGLTEYGKALMSGAAASKAVAATRAETGAVVSIAFSPSVTVNGNEGGSIAEELGRYAEQLEDQVQRILNDRDKTRRRTSYG